MSILDEIRAEREYQNTQWGVTFDDRNTLNDWSTFICMYSGRAADINSTPEDQRKYFLKTATLAVAALEAFDRNGGFPSRHYDKGAEDRTIPENPNRSRD
jgi:hypothetical protein